jgi:hypothetical protein
MGLLDALLAVNPTSRSTKVSRISGVNSNRLQVWTPPRRHQRFAASCTNTSERVWDGFAFCGALHLAAVSPTIWDWENRTGALRLWQAASHPGLKEHSLVQCRSCRLRSRPKKRKNLCATFKYFGRKPHRLLEPVVAFK